MKILQIDPKQVLLQDHTCFFPTFSNLNRLRQSVERIGIVNPPVLLQKSEGFIPVLGRRRIQAAIMLGIDEVTASTVRGLDEKECFRMAFWDNFDHRFFHGALISYLVNRILELFDKDVAYTDFFIHLGLPAFGPRIHRLQKIGRMEPQVLERWVAGKLLEKTVSLLSDMSFEVRSNLMRLIADLGLNANTADELVRNLNDHSIESNVPITDLLDYQDFQSILDDPKLDRPGKWIRFRKVIHSLRFPDYTKELERYEAQVSALRLPGNMKLKHTPFFENEKIQIEITVDCLQDAKDLIGKIRE